MRLLQHIAYFHCVASVGHDWLLTHSSVAGATFMNEFVPYTMQALPLMRRIRQRVTVIDYIRDIVI